MTIRELLKSKVRPLPPLGEVIRVSLESPVFVLFRDEDERGREVEEVLSVKKLWTRNLEGLVHVQTTNGTICVCNPYDEIHNTAKDAESAY